MRILYLCHRIPYPPDKGDKIRAFHQLRALARRHEIDLFTLVDDPADLRGQAALRQFCRRVVVAGLNPHFARLRSLPYLLSRTPLTIPYFGSEELHKNIRQALLQNSYDRIVVYCSAMAQYVESMDRIPVVTDLVDVDSDKWTQYAAFARFPLSAVYRREGEALRRYERQVCERSSCVVVTTEREARLVREITPMARVHAIPNGVDTEYFKSSIRFGEPDTPVIGFTGDMGYFPNQEAVRFFARQVLPLIRQSVPEAGFLIVGRNPSREVRNLADMKGVEVTGFVPDVRPHLSRMRISVAPFSIAAGIQNKILEAMSYELPVVATSRTAQGLTSDAAAAIEVADGPEEMAAKIVGLLRDSQVAREKGKENRRRVVSDYNWDRSLDRFQEVVENPQRTETACPPATPSLDNGWKSNCCHPGT